MKILLTLIFLITFSNTAYADAVHNNNETMPCNEGDESCFAQNANKKIAKRKHKKHTYKAQKSNNKAATKLAKKRNFNDADLEDTSQPNSFIGDANSNNAPAESPVKPPRGR